MAETRRRHGGPGVHRTSGARTAGSRFDGMSVSWLGGGETVSLDATISDFRAARRIRRADETRRPLRLPVARVRRDIGCLADRPAGPPAAPCHVIGWARPRPGLVRVPARRRTAFRGIPGLSPAAQSMAFDDPPLIARPDAAEARRGGWPWGLRRRPRPCGGGTRRCPGIRFVIDLASGRRDGRGQGLPDGTRESSERRRQRQDSSPQMGVLTSTAFPDDSQDQVIDARTVR